MNIKRLLSRILIVVIISAAYVAYLKWQTRPGMREMMRIYDSQQRILVRRFFRYGNHGRMSLHYDSNGELINGECGDFLYQVRLALKGQCRDGKWEGVVLGYDENEQLAMEGAFLDGMKHGVFKYYSHGRLNRVQLFEHGQLSGRQQDYYSNGNIRCTGVYRRHMRINEYRCYYPDGSLELEEHFRNGLRHGMHRRWDRHGQLIWEMPFVDGWEALHTDTYRVRSVIGVDTILLDNDRRVKLKGIREKAGLNREQRSQAREILKDLLREGSRFAEVRLEFSETPVEGTDWEAYVFIDTGRTLDQIKSKDNYQVPPGHYYDFFPVRFSHFINATLVNKGVVEVSDNSEDDRYYAVFKNQVQD